MNSCKFFQENKGTGIKRETAAISRLDEGLKPVVVEIVSVRSGFLEMDLDSAESEH